MEAKFEFASLRSISKITFRRYRLRKCDLDFISILPQRCSLIYKLKNKIPRNELFSFKLESWDFYYFCKL